MKFHLSMLLMLILIATASAGCKKKDVSTENYEGPALRQVKSFYPEDIHLVNRIEILEAGGERKKIENKDVIDQWLDRVGEVNVTVDPDRPDHSGSLFIVTLFVNEQEKFHLAPTSINNTKIETNDELIKLMYQLWDGETQSQ
jgi:hypothetical protein